MVYIFANSNENCLEVNMSFEEVRTILKGEKIEFSERKVGNDLFITCGKENATEGEKQGENKELENK